MVFNKSSESLGMFAAYFSNLLHDCSLSFFDFGNGRDLEGSACGRSIVRRPNRLLRPLSNGDGLGAPPAYGAASGTPTACFATSATDATSGAPPAAGTSSGTPTACFAASATDAASGAPPAAGASSVTPTAYFAASATAAFAFLDFMALLCRRVWIDTKQ